MKRIVSIITGALLLMALFAGCAQQTVSTAAGTSSTSSTATSVVSGGEAGDSMFTNRDKEIGYSEQESTIITLADGASIVNGEGAAIEGNTVTITDEGTYILSGSISDGQIIVDASDDAKVQLVLNSVDITSKSSAAIYVKKADKVFITTANESENSLSVTGELIAIDDNNIDGAVYSKSDLTLNGAGALKINCAYGHGVVSKDDLTITSGNYAVTAAKQGLSGKDSVRIADGNFILNAGTDGIHSENEDDSSLGFVYIEGGAFTISAGDDGIHAETSLEILGGNVDITKSYEGLEGLAIDISGGDISLDASDDGINATGGSSQSGGPMGEGGMASVDGCYISITGGTIKVNASGDGIDSIGNLTITGGYIIVSGPTSDGNGTIDYNGSGIINAGTLLGAGSSGMAQGFGESSAQCSIMYNLSGTQQAGTTVTLKDASGNELCEFSPEKQFQSVNISVPELTQGSSYTLVVGSEEYTIELTSVNYSNGGGMGGGQRPQGQFPSGGDGQMPPGETDGQFPQGGPGGGRDQFPPR